MVLLSNIYLFSDNEYQLSNNMYKRRIKSNQSLHTSFALEQHG
jgi:hypothetical protein